MERLTREQYYADGCTALLDAIGRTITSLDNEVAGKVLFVITTDGLENSSRHFTKDQVKHLIETHDWEFLFIGAGIDSYHEAYTLGIDANHAANYERSAGGVNGLLGSVRRYRCAYSKNEHRDVDWKEDGLD